jgi:hypothetical protein
VDQVQGIEVHAGLASLRSWRRAHFHAAVVSPTDRVQAHRGAGDVAGEIFEAIGVVGQDRQLTRLQNDGIIRTFDLTPDGKRIVIDGLHEQADIVLIELAGN